ncbi:EAL domain-containing protein [uncultured Lamprocystis sp.]|jgi:EAL domain-containing protein (putative c-di-GMP-specific phosphodiesterase class I)/GGDEF domain-containing protein/DNA-binding NarL/FixJ family response regulator|uniref:EAL domain-containing response regulator n=1 Tax=uncultured Lamprocystis sp. TaxID=543132 RepID=UPI0025F05595|nr:EAL domain-containing protein [uncultured Lamprocystis sp.]
MPAQAQAVILLVMTSQPNEAERLITSLRNGGLPVRGMYTATADRIDELVERRACDLIICCSYDPSVDLDAVLTRHRELAADVPLIVIADHHGDQESVIKALRAGARDVTDREDVEHLQLVVGRELADLRVRRQVRRLTHRLQQCESRARELVETTGEAVAFIQDGMHVHANPAYLSLFRFPTVDDLQSAAFLDLIATDQRPAVREFLRMRTTPEAQGLAEIPTSCVRADTSSFRGTLFAAPAERDGEPCLRLIVRTADRSTVLATDSTDQLHEITGAATLIAAIATALGHEGRPATPFTLFYIRLRGAADLLRTCGLTQGLAVIGSIAAPLALVCGELGVLARVSDDGYGLLVLELDETSAATLAERIRAEVRLPEAQTAQARIEADCDVGYVVVSGSCSDPKEVLDDAYRACLGGTMLIARAGMQEPTSLAARDKQPAIEGEDPLTGKIESALDNDRFILVYQPIVSLMGDNQENYTVLVRLIDESGNLLEAKDFIVPAIRSGLIERIDKWAIRNAVKTMREHRQAGQNFNFFINLAEDTFRDPSVVIWICDCLQQFDVRGNWLTFVIQEELVDGNLGSLSRLVESLKKIKCRIAVNRFGGTDHPQMLLQGLSLDFILLRPEFTQDLANDKDKQQRLLALANLAREFNVKSVVTGVEDARALTILWTAGVDYVQGNFLQRPSTNLEMAT